MTCQLEVLCLEACPGQRLAVSGASPSLGAWDPARAIPLTSNSQGFWSGSVPHQEVNAKFKLLIQNADGSLSAWEPLKHTRKWPSEASTPGTRVRAKYGKKRMKVDKGRTGTWLDGLSAFLSCCLAPEQDRRNEMDFGPPQLGHANLAPRGPGSSQGPDLRDPMMRDVGSTQAKKMPPGRTEPEQAAVPPPPVAAAPAPAKKPTGQSGRNEPEQAVAPKSPPPGPISQIGQASSPPVPIQPGCAAVLPGQVDSTPADGAESAPARQKKLMPQPKAPLPAAAEKPRAKEIEAPLPAAAEPPKAKEVEVVPPPQKEVKAQVTSVAEKAEAVLPSESTIVPYARKPSVATWLQPVPVFKALQKPLPVLVDKVPVFKALQKPLPVLVDKAAGLPCMESCEMEKPWATFDEPPATAWASSFPEPVKEVLPTKAAEVAASNSCAPQRAQAKWARMPSVATWSVARLVVETPVKEPAPVETEEELIGSA